MEMQTQILIDTEAVENNNNIFLEYSKGATNKMKTHITNPIVILSTELTNNQILKEKGTISVQNMAKAVAAAYA
ncbi:MAG TPA: hypothetical protein VLA72_15545 [Anaerolineales bacterium]|nr:hypothetical protein [Anaerolineales bacterium]